MHDIYFVNLPRSAKARLRKLSLQLPHLLPTDYILFGESKAGNSVELNMLELLCRKCPEKSRKELLTIVNAFITAVSED